MRDFLDLLRVPVWGWLFALLIVVAVMLGIFFLIELVGESVIAAIAKARRPTTAIDPDPTTVVAFHGRQQRISEREAELRLIYAAGERRHQR